MIEPRFWFWDDQCDWMLSVSDMADMLLEAITKLEAGESEEAIGDISDVARTLKRNEFSITNTDALTTDQLYGPSDSIDKMRDRLMQRREENPSPMLDEFIRRMDEMIRRREQEKENPAHAV